MQIFLPYSACGIPIDVNESTMCADDANDIYSMDQGKEFCPQCYEISIIHPAREPQAAAKKKKKLHIFCVRITPSTISKPSELE